MGGRRQYSCCFVECCFQDLFNIPRSILVEFPSSFFSKRLISVHVVHPYNRVDVTIACKKITFWLIWCLQRNCLRDNDALYKRESISSERGTIVAGVGRGDTWLIIICRAYVLRMSIGQMKGNGFTLKKGKKQTILCINYYEHRLRRWHSASGKYTCSSRILAASSEAGSW